jgi:hypothetical protein
VNGRRLNHGEGSCSAHSQRLCGNSNEHRHVAHARENQSMGWLAGWLNSTRVLHSVRTHCGPCCVRHTRLYTCVARTHTHTQLALAKLDTSHSAVQEVGSSRLRRDMLPYQSPQHTALPGSHSSIPPSSPRHLQRRISLYFTCYPPYRILS